MSEAQNEIPNVESNAESSQAPCCAVSGPCGAAVLRAVVYVPALLLTSAFAAAAMFPDLAEYATPLIDLGVKTHCASSSSNATTGPCCQQQALVSPCQGTATDAANPSSDELPADAMAAVNLVDLETASN